MSKWLPVLMLGCNKEVKRVCLRGPVYAPAGVYTRRTSASECHPLRSPSAIKTKSPYGTTLYSLYNMDLYNVLPTREDDDDETSTVSHIGVEFKVKRRNVSPARIEEPLEERERHVEYSCPGGGLSLMIQGQSTRNK